MPLRDVLIALVVVSIWGVNFTVIKLTIAELPPLLSAALRFFFAAVPVVFFVPRPKARWLLVAGYGLFMACALYALLNLALFMGLSASLASLALQVQAMFTIAIAFFVFGEVPRKLQILGAAVAFGGIGVIAYGHGTGGQLLPFGILILAALAWGIANNISKLAGSIPMLPFTVWGNLIGSIPLLVLAFVFEGGPAIFSYLDPPSWNTVMLVAFLAYPATLFGFTIWAGLLSRHSAATVAPFTLLVPIAGISSGVLILGEPIYGVDVAGGVLIFIGLVLTVAKLKPRQAPVLPGA
ncbi:EamA family transporter [Pelagibacterium sp.]|uniref:EamA family transporter n=1 Tax=Pelagibacterium sp. TaxID=1967288 RepID=UPI003A94670B